MVDPAGGGLLLLAAAGSRAARRASLHRRCSSRSAAAACWLAAGARPAASRRRRSASSSPISASRTNGTRASTARNFRALARLTGRAATREPRLILWPEAATPDYLSIRAARARRRIAAVIGPRDLLLLGGVEPIVRRRRPAPIAAYNSLYRADPGGAHRSAATTRRISCPMANICRCGRSCSALGLTRLAPGDLDFLAGPGPAHARSAAASAGPASRSATRSSSRARSSIARNRPDFIFNPSNDAWFGAWGPPQHLAQARLRAIEEGLPVIRATPTGISRGDRRRRPGARAACRRRAAGVIDAPLPPRRAADPVRPLRQLPAASPSRCCSSRRRLQSRRKTR